MDVVLIPEVPFKVYGEHGLFKYVERVLAEKGHCVMCIAEGAGQVGALPLVLGRLPWKVALGAAM